MTTYNGERYIKEQLDSILYQLDETDEIVICDDASTDRTLSIIELYKDDRIKLYVNKVQLGVIKNFEKALYIAQGDYIFLADQDDIWNLRKVDICRAFLEEYYMVVTDCVLIDEANNMIHPSYFTLYNSKPGVLNNFIKNSFVGSCMAFRKDVLVKSLPFPKNVAMHDWWVGLIGSLNYNCIFVPKSLVLHRIHGNNASSTGNVSTKSLWEKIVMRIYMAMALLKTKLI